MARIRSIKPDFWDSEDTATLSPLAALTYAGLWNLADDEGRGRFGSTLIHGRLHSVRPGVTQPKTKAALDELKERKLIITYTASDGTALYYIPTFKKHQKPQKPLPSKLQAPPVELQEDYRSATVAHPISLLKGGEGEGRGEVDGEEGERTPPPVATLLPDSEIVAAVHHHDPTFPVDRILNEISRAERFGISRTQLLADVRDRGQRMRIWTIVDGYQYPRSNGRNGHRENATAYLPSVRPDHAEREAQRQKRDAALTQCRELLLAMDADERDGWMRDAKAQAEQQKVPAAILTSYVESQLLSRIAKEHGIEGV